MKKNLFVNLLLFTVYLGAFAQSRAVSIMPALGVFRHEATLRAGDRHLYNITVSNRTELVVYTIIPTGSNLRTLITITDTAGNQVYIEGSTSIIDAGSYTVEVSGRDNTSGNYTLEAHTSNLIFVEGSGLIQKLVWLYRNVDSNSIYIMELTANESIGPQTFKFDGKNRIQIRFTSSGVERIISLSENGTLFTVESGVILRLSNGVTLRGLNNNNASLVIVNKDGQLQMRSGSKITGNTIVQYTGRGSGGVQINNATFDMTGGEISGNTSSNGGGVYINGTFNMSGGEISGNVTDYGDGGGVYLEERFSKFYMAGGKISGNTGSGVGAEVTTFGVSSNTSVITMTGGEISGNRDGGVRAMVFTMTGGEVFGNRGFRGVDARVFTMSGGVVSRNSDGGVSADNFTMNGGEIFGNTSTYGAGGVSASIFTLNNGRISGNRTTDSDGGGVAVRGTFTMNGGEISGNTTSKVGGGVYISGNGIFNMLGGEIFGNTASSGGGAYIRGSMTKTGGIIYGNTQSDNKSNRATGGNNNGHAVYVHGTNVNRRESTTEAGDNLDSKVNGIAGGWGY